MLVFASAPESGWCRCCCRRPACAGRLQPERRYSRRFPLPHPRRRAARRGPTWRATCRRRRCAWWPPHRAAAREGTHPACCSCRAAARDLHGPAGWFNKAGSFPNIEHSEYPVAAEAERAIRSGKPFLQRWLPFWLANLVERMWLALGIILAVLLPLTRIVPPLYQFRIRSRVFRWYAQLRDIENRLQAQPREAAGAVQELDALDERVGRISVPLSYADELYALRNNIDAVRRKAQAGGAPALP